MFYGQFILAKKGPLAKIWLAAHLEKKLSRPLVFETDVASAVDEVIRPKIKLSLRTNGHLLLGIVRIYAKKADYILHDLERAKKIFWHFAQEQERKRHPQPRQRHVAGTAANISTIPEEDEEVQQIELELPQMGDFAFPPGPEFNVRAKNEDITLNEQNISNNNMNNLMFAGMDLTYLDSIFEPEDDENLNGVLEGQNFDEFLEAEIGRMSRAGSEIRDMSRAGSEIRDMSRVGSEELELARRRISANTSGNQLEQNFAAPHETKTGDELSRFHEATRMSNQGLIPEEDEVPMEVDQGFMIPDEVVGGFEQELDISESTLPSRIALDPLSESQIQQELAEIRPQRRRKRARALVADENISLDDEEIRDQMSDIGDIINPISIAPPTKQLMNAKKFGSVQHIFDNPATNLFVNKNFLKIYSEHCVAKSRPESDVPTAEEIRESMGIAEEAQIEPDEMENRRSRLSSRAPSAMAGNFTMTSDLPPFNDNVDQSLLDYQPSAHSLAEPFMDNEMNMSFAMPTPIVDQPMEEEEDDEDRENVNPFAGPSQKRSKTEQEIRAEEQKVQKSTKNLFRLLKSEVAKRGTQKINFNELILADAAQPTHVQEMPQESRQNLAKTAARQFYALLELRKTRTIQVEQSASYQPIYVTVLPPANA